MSNINADSANPIVPAIYGTNTSGGDGVFGEGGQNGRGVVGVSAHHTGVEGTTVTGIAVYGGAVTGGNQGRGVVGVSDGATAVEGNSNDGAAVWGISKNGEGVHGQTSARQLAAVAGINTSTGPGVFGKSHGGRAALFDGDVEITGRLISPYLDEIVRTIGAIDSRISALEGQLAVLASRMPP